MMPKYKNGATYEFIASQIQSQKGDIICIKDGCELITFSDLKDLPSDLLREFDKRNDDIRTIEYHWRSQKTQSTYVFFLREVDNKLKEIEKEGRLTTILLPVRPKSSLVPNIIVRK